MPGEAGSTRPMTRKKPPAPPPTCWGSPPSHPWGRRRKEEPGSEGLDGCSTVGPSGAGTESGVCRLGQGHEFRSPETGVKCGVRDPGTLSCVYGGGQMGRERHHTRSRTSSEGQPDTHAHTHTPPAEAWSFLKGGTRSSGQRAERDASLHS